MSGAAPLVSVIVPAYGVAQYLGEALASLQAQTLEDWEAIVVDDGDTDPVEVAIGPFLADPRIRLLQTDNGGLSAARNAGMAVAKAPRIALLDGDDLYDPHYLERMTAALDAEPGIGFATCDARLFGNPAFEGKLFSSLEPQTGEITLERVIRADFKVFGSCTIRAALIKALGGFDESLRSAEDLDMWIRLLETGCKAVRVPEPLVHYRRRADSLSADGAALARWVLSVYHKAEHRLAGRPEAAAAHAMKADAFNKLEIEEGIAAIADGRTREGISRLAATDIAAHSPRWRLALTVFRLFPPLAGPVVRAYMQRQPFGPRG